MLNAALGGARTFVAVFRRAGVLVVIKRFTGVMSTKTIYLLMEVLTIEMFDPLENVATISGSDFGNTTTRINKTIARIAVTLQAGGVSLADAKVRAGARLVRDAMPNDHGMMRIDAERGGRNSLADLRSILCSAAGDRDQRQYEVDIKVDAIYKIVGGVEACVFKEQVIKKLIVFVTTQIQSDGICFKFCGGGEGEGPAADLFEALTEAGCKASDKGQHTLNVIVTEEWETVWLLANGDEEQEWVQNPTVPARSAKEGFTVVGPARLSRAGKEEKWTRVLPKAKAAMIKKAASKKKK